MLGGNKALVRRYYEEAMGDLSGIEEIVTEDHLDHHFPPGLPQGAEGVRQFFHNVLGSVFDDMEIEIEDMVAEGDKVAWYPALHAKHTGELAGIPATGRLVQLIGCNRYRIPDLAHEGDKHHDPVPSWHR